LLLGMRGVDQNHASNILGIKTGIEAHSESTHGVADENKRTGDSGVAQESVQFFGKVFAGAWVRAGIAEAKARAIVGTNSGTLRELGLYFVPRHVGIAEAGIEDHRWSSLPHAIDVHGVAADVDKLAREGVSPTVARGGENLVDHSCGSEKDCDCGYDDEDVAEPEIRLRDWVSGDGHLLFFGRDAGEGARATRSYLPHNSYMTGGTVMPITASVRINSRRTTATVARRNCFRFSSVSLRMGCR